MRSMQCGSGLLDDPDCPSWWHFGEHTWGLSMSAISTPGYSGSLYHA
jgi:hypothetical protein